MKVKESLNVTFDETPPPSKTSPLEDDDLVEEEAIEVSKTRPLENNLEDNSLENNEIINIKESKSHPLENVIEPKNINEALKDESWVITMQEELNQFVSNDVWELVPNPMDMTIIETKWVFRNKLDENGVVSRNKANAPVARLESIRILLAYACALDFKLFQMDVKSAFLNGFINEEVYVAQPSGFIDFAKPNHVYRLKKALYRLKQASKAWYDRLKAFLIKHDYTMGMVDNILFTKKKDPNLIIVQIYVDDIIFGSTCQEMCDDFAKIMHDEFEMSMMGKLNFFLGLQIKQLEDVSSMGKWVRLRLEKSVRRSGDEVFVCSTSQIDTDKLTNWIETDECLEACGLNRNVLGISSDSLLESKFTQKLCSTQCYDGCPNIVDLYFNLAAGEVQTYRAQAVIVLFAAASQRANPYGSSLVFNMPIITKS
ncbi:retrovirus-related pol polyprotein from transposon TNT 1-94 [Tanacetum coccineum]|uniref:Retrovirus-related pol polyprotein from transposon TNT 1-94 n=1 Tax=Tanacetum coccineum TaxID=301880 RepID=A0ABQ5GMZ2_9ASTR